jgi:hypothetical protein
VTRRHVPPAEAAAIAERAADLQCSDCGAQPGQPCIPPGGAGRVCRSRFIAGAIEAKRDARATRATPEQQAILASLPRVPREVLAGWGVPWPPPPGWRHVLEHGYDGGEVSQ